MRRIVIGFIALSVTSLLLYSCKKSSDGIKPDASTVTATDLANLHGMGLNPMDPSDWAGVPAFTPDLFRNNLQTNGLSYTGTMPGSYLLETPQIRDQGQMGSCTGFCGTESDEILYYYKNNSAATGFTNLTTANGASTAYANEMPNTSDEPLYGGPGNATSALSPLFLYFTERVVVSHGSIGSDPGANMVNIGEALQGLTNNTGTGKALIYNSYTFDGITVEANYPYPWLLGSGGYNVATSSNSPYKVYPYTYFNYGSTTMPVAPNNFPIGGQSGTTNSSGATAHGYYVISSTGTALVNDVKTALLNNKPVMMGFNVYDKSSAGYPYFENLSTTSYTYNPLNSNGSLVSGIRLMGGHAVPIVGYINDTKQPGGGVFICQNSWGTPWGYHGYFYLPYTVVQNTRVVSAGSLYVMIL
jgi:hypothetical protein